MISPPPLEERYQQALDLMVAVQRASAWLREAGAIRSAVDEFLTQAQGDWRPPWRREFIGADIREAINRAGLEYVAVYRSALEDHHVLVYRGRAREAALLGHLELGPRVGDVTFVGLDPSTEQGLRAVLAELYSGAVDGAAAYRTAMLSHPPCAPPTEAAKTPVKVHWTAIGDVWKEGPGRWAWQLRSHPAVVGAERRKGEATHQCRLAWLRIHEPTSAMLRNTETK